MINYGRQFIDEADIETVVEVLRSDFITQGPVVEHFEKQLAEYCDNAFAITCSSATAGLHLACLAAGIGKGDRVWTSPISFVASANCALYTGASVDFVDIDLTTGLMCPVHLEEKLSNSANNGELPKAIIVVHFAGQPCDMNRIHDLCEHYNVSVIEDASHALGAEYDGFKVGSSCRSLASIFSFHPVKMITTGEGGAVVCKDENLANNIKKLRSHGIERRPNIAPWYYEQTSLGFNYRMPDILAALGVSQLSKLDFFIEKRRSLDQFYRDILSETNIHCLKQNNNANSSVHLFPILLKDEQQRLSVYKALKNHDINPQIHYIPIYKQPYYAKTGYKPLNNCEQFYERVISLPLHVGLDESDIKRITTVVKEVVYEN